MDRKWVYFVNEFGFIFDEVTNDWVDAKGECWKCLKVSYLRCLDTHGRFWCDLCVNEVIDSVV